MSERNDATTLAPASPAHRELARCATQWIELLALNCEQLARDVLDPHHASRNDLDAHMESRVREVLLAESRLIGAGYVATEEAALGRRMSWWQRRDGTEGVIQRLDAAGHGLGDARSDIDAADWFVLPLQSGRPELAGPYVDYLCTEDLTMTYSQPVFRDGRTLGVVGCDVAVRHLEDEFHRVLHRCHETGIVATEEGRVIASTASDYTVMDRVEVDASGPQWTVLVPGSFRYTGVAGEQLHLDA